MIRKPFLVLAGGLLASSTFVAASAATSPPPPSVRTLVGIMVDSKDGLTETSINCGRDGKHQTVNGDGSLFMPNLYPHRMICVITIRQKGSTT
jgi:hypothetical protein